MGEQVLKVSLKELMETIRIKKKNNTVVEAHGFEAMRDVAAQIRDNEHRLSGEELFKFINAAERLVVNDSPIEVEFTVSAK